MVEKTMVFKDMVIPDDDALYDIYIDIDIDVEDINTDSDYDEDDDTDLISCLWQIKEIRLTDFTRKPTAGMKTAWGIGFNLVDKNCVKKVNNFVSSFEFSEYVYDKLSESTNMKREDTL
jgi:hypothetical protein